MHRNPPQSLRDVVERTLEVLVIALCMFRVRADVSLAEYAQTPISHGIFLAWLWPGQVRSRTTVIHTRTVKHFLSERGDVIALWLCMRLIAYRAASRLPE
jgi:hypothetical protein